MRMRFSCRSFRIFLGVLCLACANRLVFITRLFRDLITLQLLCFQTIEIEMRKTKVYPFQTSKNGSCRRLQISFNFFELVICISFLISFRGWSKSRRGGGWAGGKWVVRQQVLSLSKGWVTPVFSQWWGGS